MSSHTTDQNEKWTNRPKWDGRVNFNSFYFDVGRTVKFVQFDELIHPLKFDHASNEHLVSRFQLLHI